MSIGFNKHYLTKGGTPWFPVMGEIHYSRLPENEWSEALYKMKAGGVNIAACYTIWIHHEEEEGVWDFNERRNLRRFLDTASNCGMYVFLRIGPWCHAEVRNGGFPDWLLKKDFKPRTNDESYFFYVEKFYKKIFEQAEGLFIKDNGPVIGVQIENEYGHCHGLTGMDGEEHMKRLTRMAKEIGYDAPIYTATGWGGAVTGGLLPVMGGYCDAPWDQRLTEIEPSGNFIFTHERNDHNIGSDLGQGAGLTFNPDDFPYLTAELGGGLQVTKHRRPVARPADAAAMSIVKMGSGANLLGYYMYHGGVNPKGRLSTLQESRETGYLNDLPVKSYDFRAPLGAYGQINGSYKELKMIAMFTADFGSELCKMPSLIPDNNPLKPDDDVNLRYSFRHNGQWGFVFFNNYVRGRKRPDFESVSVTVPEIGLKLPEFSVLSGCFGFYPFNMPVTGGAIHFAEATPLCTVNSTTVLYGKNIECDSSADVLLISREDGLNAYKIKLTDEHLLISSYPVIPDENGWYILAEGDITLKAYPAFPQIPEGFTESGTDGKFTLYTNQISEDTASCRITKVTDTNFRVDILNLSTDAYEYRLVLDYLAESAKAFIDGNFIYDDFWADGSMLMALGRHGFPKAIDLELTPLYADTPVYLETWPDDIPERGVCTLDGAKLIKVVKVPL